MDELIKLIRAKLAELRSGLNNLLANQPPVDQLSAFPAIQGLFSDARYWVKRLEETDEALSGDGANDAPAVLAQLKESVADSALAAALESGDLLNPEKVTELVSAKIEEEKLLTPAEVEGQITAAVTAAKSEKDAEIAAERELQSTITLRREEAIEEHGSIMASISADDLAAEDHADRVTMLAGRVTALAEVGITKEAAEAPFNLYCSRPLDEEGEKTFQAELEALKAIGLKASAAPSSGNVPPKKPSTTASLSASGDQNDPPAPSYDVVFI